ncbi:MAG: alpha/beta hydrolase [Acidobacteriia bacterium]|nr:alpha/beta hydrolase [Terriglobia bacterium]
MNASINVPQNARSLAAEAPPPPPSLRARILTAIVRRVLKGWPRRGPQDALRWARRFFNSPGFMSFLHLHGLEVTSVSEGGVRGEWLVPKSGAPQRKVLLYLHGGGYVSCSPRSHRPITANLARLLGQRVFSLEYRLAPEHPFPAAVDDASAAYRWLLSQGFAPRNIAIAGDSAGGGLTVATLLRLRREKQPLPACAACLSPWVDLTGKFAYRNAESCAMFRPSDIANFASLYLNGAPAEAEEASPLFADLGGLPPLFILASASEMLLDDAARLHEKALSCGVPSKLRAYPGLPHDWPLAVGLIPEAMLALREVAGFVAAGLKEG